MNIKSTKHDATHGTEKEETGMKTATQKVLEIYIKI